MTEQDALGQTTSFTYDGRDNMLSQADPLGATTRFTWSPLNRPLSITDPNGRRATLAYDEFGNLTIDASTTDAAAPVAAREVSMLSFKGRAVLDVAKRELKLMDLTGNVNPDEVLSPARRRRYEINADTLTLSSFDDQGQVTAIATWRRRQ